ncbi:MAG: DNA mismatch repair endonuclease MutL, partial [Clostridia bacterium]|nr:DNA mismatch repair endonuclease MutL [Clostridia bacterium]
KYKLCPSGYRYCFFIDTEKNGIKIKGYIGKHNFSKPNRTYQSLFVNGRYVINQTVSASISNAYANYLMKRQYPFYVLSIDLPSDSVDVNVHPSKIEVRFSNNQIVYSSIYSVISKVLDGGKEALNIVVDDKKFIPTFEKSSKTENNKINNEVYKFNKVIFADSKNDFSFNDIKKNEQEQKGNVVDIFAENKAYLEQLEKQKQESSIQTKVVIEKDLKYIGQVLNTYLIFDDGEDIYFIDQHAAHERILFDKFMSQVKNKKFDIQPLLVPYVEELNENEFEFIISKLNVLNEMGIEVSEFGANTIKISALPTCLIDIDIKEFLSSILFDLNQLKSISIIDLLKEKIAQKACKSAIKSGDKLNDADIKIIMEEIKMDLGLKCPHGRPIAIKITRNEIDKWFKRIV